MEGIVQYTGLINTRFKSVPRLLFFSSRFYPYFPFFPQFPYSKEMLLDSLFLVLTITPEYMLSDNCLGIILLYMYDQVPNFNCGLETGNPNTNEIKLNLLINIPNELPQFIDLFMLIMLVIICYDLFIFKFLHPPFH